MWSTNAPALASGLRFIDTPSVPASAAGYAKLSFTTPAAPRSRNSATISNARAQSSIELGRRDVDRQPLRDHRAPPSSAATIARGKPASKPARTSISAAPTRTTINAALGVPTVIDSTNAGEAGGGVESPGTAVAVLRLMTTLRATFTLLSLVACGASDSTPRDAAIVDVAIGDAPNLSLLPSGNHLGLWPTYDLLPVGTAAAADLRLQEARAAGMSIARVHVAWGDLEPSRNNFALGELRTSLASATNNGLAIHLLIESVDSDGFSLPPDLIDADVEYGLRDGMHFDDPIILARFAALLDRVLPELDGHRVFAISVGNEPDNRLDDIPPTSAEGLAWIGENARFLTAARTHIHARNPLLAVAITLAQGSLQKGFTTLGPVIEAGDAAVFNYYCQDRDFQVKPAAVVAGELDGLERAAGGRPLILQELGCPAGKTGSVLGASELAQAAFYAEVGQQMTTRTTLRAAFGFQLVDWSPALVAEFTQPLRDEGFDELADRYGETLASIGLLRYQDGSARPAWDAIVDAIGALRR